jgi:uncharacterized protein YeaO (DUF488 family)
MKTKHAVNVKRVYDPPANADGARVLVDRIWPRGLSKAKARVDVWLKEIAPSTELRKWFGHDPAKWDDFERRYFEELDGRSEAVSQLLDLAKKQRVTLLFAATDTEHNNAVALKKYVASRR